MDRVLFKVRATEYGSVTWLTYTSWVLGAKTVTS